MERLYHFARIGRETADTAQKSLNDTQKENRITSEHSICGPGSETVLLFSEAEAFAGLLIRKFQADR
jgi:hypothetical protein